MKIITLRDKVIIDGSGTFLLTKNNTAISIKNGSKIYSESIAVNLNNWTIDGQMNKSFKGKMKTSWNALKFIWKKEKQK